MALPGAVVALWAEFPETGAASLFTFEAGAPVSFCTGVRKFPEAAGRALEMGALLALPGAVVALWAEFPETGAASLFTFEADAPVSFCTGVRKFPKAAGRALEMGALLALPGAVAAL